MNHFKGKQFQQDVIIVAVGYYLRYNLSYREVQEILYDRALTFLIRRFIVGCKNMANYSIKFGKRKIKNPFIHGKWMKRTSKLKENGIICIEPSMQMV
ncbi:transposase for insertion sequence-like element IS431mec [Enterococcus faecalis]|nr:transposase for insertion sequence-like element IS431mec [Enterococcus faecalis]